MLLRQHVNSGVCNHRGHSAALGRDQTYGFRTTPLKEYPPGLCRFITELYMATWQDMLETTGTEPLVHNQLQRLCKQVDVQATMGKDYAADKQMPDICYGDLLTEHIKEEPVTPTEDARSLATDGGQN